MDLFEEIIDWAIAMLNNDEMQDYKQLFEEKKKLLADEMKIAADENKSTKEMKIKSLCEKIAKIRKDNDDAKLRAFFANAYFDKGDCKTAKKICDDAIRKGLGNEEIDSILDKITTNNK